MLFIKMLFWGLPGEKTQMGLCKGEKMLCGETGVEDKQRVSRLESWTIGTSSNVSFRLPCLKS